MGCALPRWPDNEAMSTVPPSLPGPLESAVQRLKACAREACQRSAESLGLAAMAATRAAQREVLQTAQGELSRKQSVFAFAFDETLDRLVAREVWGRPQAHASAGLDWQALSLVADDEIELRVRGARLGFEIGRGCEWERREFDSFLTPLLAAAGAQPQADEPNPLRPENIGLAVARGAEALTTMSDVRHALESEITRSMASTMAQTYAAIVADLRASGLKPAGMSVRVSEAAPAAASPRRGGPDSVPRDREAGDTTPASPASGFSSSRQDRFGGPSEPARLGAAMGRVGAQVMSLIRQITQRQPRDAGMAAAAAAVAAGAPVPPPDRSPEGTPLVAPNLIRAHREALREATSGALDHMVIDVVSALFDQILSDPKVPPQMARQIGRLQLPVLRAALGDTSFFASRRHPVRRFVNRLASLAAGCEGLDDEAGQELVTRVAALVQQIVEGDFEQMGLYEQKIALLEAFVAEQARREVAASGDPVALLQAKETELQLRQRYARQLDRELLVLSGPDFLRDFLSGAWSAVLMKAAQDDGADTARVDRFRHAARDLFMSVQPKGSALQRKAFVAQLPRLMQTLNEGLDLIAWPESRRKAFFAELMPAHAQSLRGEGLSTLDFNLLAKQAGAVFEMPMPGVADLGPLTAMAAMPALDEQAVGSAFTEQEARSAGLASEARFALDQPLPAAGADDSRSGKAQPGLQDSGAEADAETPLRTEDITLDGLPYPEPVDPLQGAALAEQVQLGQAYRMHLDGQWQKVRLSHVSPGRNFFVFTRGRQHPQAISLTRRMLVRLCEADRLRAFESAYLLERATARVRKQLAALKTATN